MQSPSDVWTISREISLSQQLCTNDLLPEQETISSRTGWGTRRAEIYQVLSPVPLIMAKKKKNKFDRLRAEEF